MSFVWSDWLTDWEKRATDVEHKMKNNAAEKLTVFETNEISMSHSYIGKRGKNKENGWVVLFQVESATFRGTPPS